MTTGSFLRGAAILALASAASRILGLVHMVVLPRIILDEGMGLLQLVQPAYYFTAVLAIFGMPIAVAKLVAEYAAVASPSGVLKVLRQSLVLTLVTGTTAALLILFSADYFALHIARDPGVYPVLMVLAPAVLLLGLSAVLRGFFQGFQYMVPAAIAQISDQFVKVTTAITLAALWRPRGVESAVVGAALGFAAGEVISVLVLTSCYFVRGRLLIAALSSQASGKRGRRQRKDGLLLGRMLRLACPVVVATVLWPLMHLLDTVIVPIRLAAIGFSPQAIRDTMGYLGMALNVVQLPNIITVALAVSLVPAVAKAFALDAQARIRRQAGEAIRVAMLMGLPACLGMLVLARPLAALLFGYPQAGEPLRILAPGAVALGLIQVTSGVLQGIGCMMLPVRHLLIGVIVKLVCNLLLTGFPGLGMLGAAVGSTLGWSVAAALNLRAVQQRVGVTIRWNDVVCRPLFAGLVTAVCVHFLYAALLVLLSPWLTAAAANAAAVILCVLYAVVFYGVSLMSWGVLSSRDFASVSDTGRQLALVLHRWGLLRS